MMSFRIVPYFSPSPLGEGGGLAGNSSGLLLARETVARCSGLRALRVEREPVQDLAYRFKRALS